MDPQQITNPSNIEKLRIANGKFMEGPFIAALTKEIRALGVTEKILEVTLRPRKNSNEDPRIVLLGYPSIFERKGAYEKDKVELEIGARSLREPFTPRSITPIVDQVFTQLDTGIGELEVPAVNPERTFLEKLFLLHEELTKASEKVRHFRISCHLYDIAFLAASEFGQRGLQDKELFHTISRHRALYNEQSHVDYENISLSTLQFIPASDIIDP